MLASLMRLTEGIAAGTIIESPEAKLRSRLPRVTCLRPCSTRHTNGLAMVCSSPPGAVPRTKNSPGTGVATIPAAPAWVRV